MRKSFFGRFYIRKLCGGYRNGVASDLGKSVAKKARRVFFTQHNSLGGINVNKKNISHNAALKSKPEYRA